MALRVTLTKWQIKPHKNASFWPPEASWKNTPYPEVPSSVFQRLF